MDNCRNMCYTNYATHKEAWVCIRKRMQTLFCHTHAGLKCVATLKHSCVFLVRGCANGYAFFMLSWGIYICIA